MILEIGNNVTKIVRDQKDKLKGIDPVKLIKEYLRVRVDGYYHSTAYKKKRWDGYKSFVTYGKFNTGFLPFVLLYVKQEGLSYEIVDLRGDIPKLKDEIQLEYGDMTLRDYQERAVYTMDKYLYDEVYFPRGIFNLATNAGKTLTVEAVYTNFDRPLKCLYLVHNKDLFTQAVGDFSKRHDVGIVNDKEVRFTAFTVCMNKSMLYKAKQSTAVLAKIKEYDMVVVDECHRACSSEYQELLSMISAPIRLFVSGTAMEHKSSVKNLSILGQSGSELIQVTNKELKEKGVSLPVRVTMYKSDEHLGIKHYDEMLNRGVKRSEERFQLLKTALKERAGKSVLITVQEIDHGDYIYRKLCEEIPELCFEFIHGQAKNRAGGLERFKRKEIDVLISTMIVKEGLNIPNIEVLVRLEGGESKITTKQVAGRGMRKDGIMEELEIIDFMDMGKYIEKHSRKRARDYISEGYIFEPQYDTRGKYIAA